MNNRRLKCIEHVQNGSWHSSDILCDVRVCGSITGDAMDGVLLWASRMTPSGESQIEALLQVMETCAKFNHRDR